MTLASGGSPIFPLVIHQPASPSIWPAVHSLRQGMSTNIFDLASTLCNHTLRKGGLFVMSCARVRRVRRGSIELIICGGGVRSIFYFLLWIEA